ncbi:MAG: hypothetical protein JNJ57_16285 [Saprospiraceae bacterium]|nr:hypothetical protein [Saprospiraceae bacterium]
MNKTLFSACILFVALLLPAAPAQAAPQPVQTGMYLVNLYGLNMEEHSFYADFYIWFKWKGDIDPTNIEFVNAIEKWSMNNATFDEDSTKVLKDGTNYRIFRIEARFFHAFSLNRFPLDRHALDIQIENPEYPIDQLIYVPDTNAAAVRKSLNLVGWEDEGCKISTRLHDYGTNFGNPEENAQVFSNLTYTITLARPFSYFLLKMLLPIFVVMLVSIGALLAHPEFVDTRSSLPIGGLLTAVFLQQSYSGALPDVGYMVLMDKIYLLCYALISMILLQIIRAGDGKGTPEAIKALIARERLYAKLFLAIFVAGIMVLCLF